ncbi:MAG TPA: HNH endonuclease [Lentimicrobium sp.]|nr:HNH endonuclease [Lentimicrobium sp.]
MGINERQIVKGLFINGIFEGVLEEILSSQKRNRLKVSYLQPFSEKIIRGLKEMPPGKDMKWVLYASTTKDLNNIVYSAEIIGWENKLELSQERIDVVDAHIKEYQPGEECLYFEKKKQCTNLISLTDLRKLQNPIPVNHIFKTSDGTSLKSRSRAGGWSYVYPISQEVPSGLILKSVFDAEFETSIKQSLKDNQNSRLARLETATKLPAKTAVVSYAYNRNSDVVAEVLLRANGKCELCKQNAPFIKASDETPYLEVHHWVPLAEHGEDALENAAALCPNCHKNAHFGQFKEYIRLHHKLPGKNY